MRQKIGDGDDILILALVKLAKRIRTNKALNVVYGGAVFVCKKKSWDFYMYDTCHTTNTCQLCLVTISGNGVGHVKAL